MIRRFLLAALLSVACWSVARAETVLKALLNIELQILDPQVTNATSTRALGYLVYDTLFSMDSKGLIRPQMVDRYTVSEDRLTWTFVLRPGLTFHDGSPVTSEDVLATLRRWGRNDAFGKRLFDSTREMVAISPDTFELRLSKPFAFVTEALGKPNAFVPFIMPAKQLAGATAKPLSEAVGSGPFVFRKDLWRPGDHAFLDRFAGYKPRSEPADGFAGGKVAHVDRVELINIPDVATRIAAIQSGSVDYLEVIPFDYIPKFSADKNIVLIGQPSMGQIMGGLNVNNTQPPLDKPGIRRAIQMAVDQHEIMEGMGIPSSMYKPFCQAVFLCGGPFESDVGTERLRNRSSEIAKRMAKEAGYNNEPIVLLHSTDSATINPMTLVLIDQLRRAGFNIDVQAADYATQAQRRMKKEPLDKGGWSLMPVVWSGYDRINPLSHYATSYSCGGTYPGWNCDPDMPALVERFSQEIDPLKRKALAEEMQMRVIENAPEVSLGQFSPPGALRANVRGMIANGMSVFWNVRKD